MGNAEILAHTDHMSLNEFAEFLEQSAELIRHKALENSKRPGESEAGAIDFLLRTPRIVMRYLNKGETLECAIAKTARETGAPTGSIERSWKRFCGDKSIYELRRRNRLIIELAAMGFKNADIGRKVDLHPNSVSRIIAQARRHHHQARTAQPNTDLILKGGMIAHNDSGIF